MRAVQALCVCLLAGATLGAQATILASSTFDTGADGWSAFNGAGPVTFNASGGDPGGFVSVEDERVDKLWIWNAPDKFKGDFSAASAGVLYLSLKSSRDANNSDGIPDVRLIGGGLSLVADIGPGPGKAWTQYAVSLAPGAWHLDDLSGALATAADLQAVLSGVTALRIRGEYSTYARDIGSLDTVFISTTPIPEPATWALWLAGAALLGARARRRR